MSPFGVSIPNGIPQIKRGRAYTGPSPSPILASAAISLFVSPPDYHLSSLTFVSWCPNQAQCPRQEWRGPADEPAACHCVYDGVVCLPTQSSHCNVWGAWWSSPAPHPRGLIHWATLTVLDCHYMIRTHSGSQKIMPLYRFLHTVSCGNCENMNLHCTKSNICLFSQY